MLDLHQQVFHVSFNPCFSRLKLEEVCCAGTGLNSPILGWVFLCLWLDLGIHVREIGVLKADAVITICGGFVWVCDLCVPGGWAGAAPVYTSKVPPCHYSMGRIIPAAPCTTVRFASCLGLVLAWLGHQRW